jgi:urease accessory protein UreF
MSDAESKGVAERPDTDTMQNAVDALRRMLVGEDQPRQLRDATARMGADMLELAIDWLSDQHGLIVQLQHPPPRTEPSVLAKELVAIALQVEQAHRNAGLGGPAVTVRIKDPLYLADLLRRAAEAMPL